MTLMQSGGKICVAVLIMIGAYFLVGKKFKFSRIINLSLIDDKKQENIKKDESNTVTKAGTGINTAKNASQKRLIVIGI